MLDSMTSTNLQPNEQVKQKITESSELLQDAFSQVSNLIVGQQNIYQRIFMALLCKGHILIEGLPGLAKTTTIKTVAEVADLGFKRIQFTPDLLPADVVGTQIYNPNKAEFSVKKGPIFTDLLLADEINRAPAKVQSALLEAMGERQVTIADQTFTLAKTFTVMATQNPIEQEGTYPLPEAQLDRFLFKVEVGYSTLEEEIEIVNRMNTTNHPSLQKVLDRNQILEMQILLDHIYVDEKVRRYIVELVYATRFPEKIGLKNIAPYIRYGASPRASIFLEKAARANALIQGRSYVTPQDVKDCGLDVFRHRIALSYEADVEQIKTEQVVQKIFASVRVP